MAFDDMSSKLKLFEPGLFYVKYAVFSDLWLGISLYLLVLACCLNLGAFCGILDDRMSLDMFVGVIAVNPQETKLLL